MAGVTNSFARRQRGVDARRRVDPEAQLASFLLRVLRIARERLSKHWRATLIFIAGLLMAAVQLSANSWGIEQFWLRPSEQVMHDRLRARTLWGGNTQLADQPPRVSLDNDSYYVIEYAREMFDRGIWRLRWSDLDNAPYGRPMHWSQAVMWLLIGLGELVHCATGQPMDQAIASASVWAGPALLGAVILLAALAVWQRWNAWAAAMTAILISAMPSILWDYSYGRPTHHGFHIASAMGMMLGLLLGGGGWVSDDATDGGTPAGFCFPRQRIARNYFIASGFFAGMELWIGATQQMFILSAVGMGALAGALLVPRGGVISRGAARLHFDPSLWKLWGRAGASAATGFYLLEYFPHLFMMRLEVNGPLYIIALVCGGELIYRVGQWRCDGAKGESIPWLGMGLALGGVLLLPFALELGPAHWHAWHDPYMRRLHDYINEFLPIVQWLADRPWYVSLRPYGALCLLLVFSPIAIFWRGIGPAWRMRLLIPLAAAVVTGAMVVRQVRWTGLLSTSLLCLALATLGAVSQLLARRTWRAFWISVLAAALVSPSLWLFWSDFADTRRMVMAGLSPPQLSQSIVMRDVAFNLLRYANGRTINVMSPPNDPPALSYFGGARGVGALYWEDIDGVHDQADFWADYGEADARRIVRERQIDFIVCNQDPMLCEYMHYVKYGTKDPKDLQRTMAFRLASPLGDIPDWLEPLPYYASPAAAAYGVRIYRVLPSALQ